MGMSMNKSKGKAIQHDLMMKTDVSQLFVLMCMPVCLCVSLSVCLSLGT